MLETLQIQDFALIDDVEVSFRPGFNALTGETGAGKSIVVSALNLVLGARATATTVRTGKEQARIDAVFSIGTPTGALRELLAAQAIQPEDGTLHLTRVISNEGRSRAYVCGTLVPASVLAAIGDELVDLHGQHEHQSLLKAERQLDLLDAFGGLDDQAGKLAAAVQALRGIESNLRALESDDRDRLRRLEFHRFELDEIDKAALQPDEEEELRQIRSRMTNAEEIVELRAALTTRLLENEENPPASELLSHALADLERLASLDAHYQPLLEQFNRFYNEFEEFSSTMQAGSADYEYDPEQLNSINARLSMIADLKRKYGATVADLLAYRDAIAAEIDQHDRRDEHLNRLREERDRACGEAEALAEALSRKRAATAKKLEKEVTSILKALGMDACKFVVGLDRAELTMRGFERADFLISANAGERPKPLRQIASGGEISRVMLAIKAAFAGTDPVDTLVFDEIDAGIGGAVANQVAETMAALAENHQVICVTHLAQIAARAGTHFHVSKTTTKKRTQTSVQQVEHEDRVQEVARLLDGSLSDVSVRHARALLNAPARESA